MSIPFSKYKNKNRSINKYLFDDMVAKNLMGVTLQKLGVLMGIYGKQ